MTIESDANIGPELLPFAPLIYLVWADGELTDSELNQLRRSLADADLGEETRSAVEAWLDPADPPTPAALERLVQAGRAAAREADGHPSSLAELGASLAAATHVAGHADRVRRAIQAIEPALGLIGDEAARAVLENRTELPAETPPGFDATAMHAYINDYHSDLRTRILDILSRPEFAYVSIHDIDAYRERVLEWCRLLAAEGIGAIAFPREFGGEHDAARAIVAFETIAYHDLSLLIKFGVHFGLFGGSIWLLGTRRHHEKWLADVATLAMPGCFAMTETAHGSNVRDIETTVTFVPETGELEVHTPNDGARKDYIGNAAVHGRLATVFAQLDTRGERHGVHAVLVPIRDASGKPLPGIRIEDCGPKEGLNGVDNGRLWFDHVRVPRENLLNRFADLAEDGTYSSPIASAGRRFFTMLGTLVAGRVAIAAGSVSATRTALTIAVRYTATRRQFGPEGRPEVPVLDYRVMQRNLLPRLATTYALGFAITNLIRRFAARTEQDAQEVEALAAGLKAWASRHAVETVQACREACGGQGYLEVNRISTLRADTDVFTTFEGANVVLLQLVAKGRLTDYREQFGDLKLWNVVRWIGSRAARTITERNPIATRRAATDHLRDAEFHLAALQYREDRLVASLANRLRTRIHDGQDSFEALNDCQDHAVTAARAWIERHTFEQLAEGVRSSPADLRPTLETVSALFALNLIERDIGWYLAKGYVEAGKAEAVRDEVNALCRELRPDAVALVAAFGIPDAVIGAPIARNGSA